MAPTRIPTDGAVGAKAPHRIAKRLPSVALCFGSTSSPSSSSSRPVKDPRINKQAAASEVGAVSSPAAADPEMMEVDIKELEGPAEADLWVIFGLFHNPNSYCHGIASLGAVRHALYCLGLHAEQEQLVPASCSDLKTGLRCNNVTCLCIVFAQSAYPLNVQDDYDGSMNHILDRFPNLFKVTSRHSSLKTSGWGCCRWHSISDSMPTGKQLSCGPSAVNTPGAWPFLFTAATARRLARRAGARAVHGRRTPWLRRAIP